MTREDGAALRLGRATGPEERRAAFALRYQVFVEEGGRFQAQADHAARLHEDPHDATACLLSATIGGRTVGTVRYHHGAATGIPAEYVALLELHRLAPAPFAEVAVLNWLAIAADRRGTRVPIELLRRVVAELRPLGTRLMVMHALDRPRTTAFYRMLGFRPYLPHTVPAWDGLPIVPMVGRLDGGPGPAVSLAP